MRHIGAAWLAALLLAGAAQAATLRIGLNEDPDALDPARGGSFVGRVVFAAVCDKLVDIDAQNNFVPQLATAWAWSADNLALTVTLRDGVKFHDGQAMDADAVKANLERYRSAPESLRKGELKPVSSVEVVDPHTVRLHLSQPYAPLVAVLADRAGMMISPKALGRDVTPDLPCAGPFKLTERVAQDRIVVDRFPGYWNADAVKLDRIVYHPQPDTTVRLVNLQAGQLDMVERLGPTDVATVKKNAKLKLISQTALAYYSMNINLAADSPLKDPRVRAALEAAIDRGVLNQVVFDGQFIPSNQFEAPGSRYWDPDHPVPPRDVAKAKALLKEAGHGASRLHAADRQQPGGAAGRPGGAVDGGRSRLRHQAAGRRGECAGRRRTVRQLSGDDRDLERPARSGRQRGDLARLRRVPELGQVLQSEVRRPAGPRARRDRRGAASGAVPAAG